MTYAHITIPNVKMYKNGLYYIIDKLQHHRQNHAPMATKILHTSKTFCELTNRKVHESTLFQYVTIMSAYESELRIINLLLYIRHEIINTYFTFISVLIDQRFLTFAVRRTF